LFRLRARTGFPLTPHFGSLPAGPHERCRHCGDPGRLPTVSRRFSRERVSSLDARSPATPKPRPGRERASQTPLIDFCNRREGRAHPGATRYPARRRSSRRRSTIEGRGRQAPVTRLGVELPHCRSLRSDQALPRRTRGLLGSKAGTPVEHGIGKHSWRGCHRTVPQGPPSTCRANGEAVERTGVPSRCSKPRLSPRPFADSLGVERRRPFFTHTTAWP
jgi:hypothetical protein